MKNPHGPLDLFTIDEIAEALVNTDSGKQALLLNAMGRRFKAEKWGEMQECYLADELDTDGTHLVYTLSNFKKVQFIPWTSPKHAQLIDTYDTNSLDEIKRQLALKGHDNG